MSLKQKAINGLAWSFIDTFAGQGIQFIIGIILARLLSPREFGLIGMITVFIAVSQSFVDSGFSQALIRKKDCSKIDYSTVFLFNFAAGVLLFLLLVLSSPAISRFFEEPQLKLILQILSLVLIIDSLTIIQRTILIKRIDFKLQARISIIASTGSGTIAITMAYMGFGVWSLVILQISKQTIFSIFLWLWGEWKPIFAFSKKSFNELFGFGSKLLLSRLIETTYRNIYYLIIGKYFSAQELGFYTRADQFRNLPSQNITSVIQRVTYPVLATIQDDIPRLRNSYQKVIRSTMFITFILMFGMAAVAKPLIITLIGEKWIASTVYLQMLCFVGMFYPLHALNLNMLNIQGRSDLFLKLEVIKKILAIPTIIIGIIWGIKIMIAGMILNSIIAYYLNSYWSGHMIGYSFKQQVKDILPALAMATIMGIIVYSLSSFVSLRPFQMLTTQVMTGAVFIIMFSEITRFKDYLFLKALALEKISSIIKQKNEKTK